MFASKSGLHSSNKLNAISRTIPSRFEEYTNAHCWIFLLSNNSLHQEVIKVALVVINEPN